MPAKVSGTLLCNIGVCTVVIWAHSRLIRGPNWAKNGQYLAKKDIDFEETPIKKPLDFTSTFKAAASLGL